MNPNEMATTLPAIKQLKGSITRNDHTFWTFTTKNIQ